LDHLFLDANILFSAAYRQDAGIGRLWHFDNVKLITSPYAAEEARINLTDTDQRQRLETLLGSVVIVTGVSGLPRGIVLPEKDRPILQAAIQARATHLLTGDKRHVGRYFGKRYGGVLVMARPSTSAAEGTDQMDLRYALGVGLQHLLSMLARGLR
jgi:predicted nucleic acid-binding protein